MDRIRLENQAVLYPMPVVIVGTLVDGRPNYMTAAWATPVNYKPVMIGVALGRSHHTTRGIREHGEFSLSIPSCALMEAVDYAGIVSGEKTDKSGLFTPFYGELKHAPMAAECPLAMECRVTQVVSLPLDDFFIAELVGVHAAPECVTGGEFDLAKASPFVFTMPDRGYWALGERIGDAWKAGKKHGA